jgi:DNA-binding NarL/FixJ family response regulator
MARHSLRVILDPEAEFTVTGEAASLAEATIIAGAQQPDVVVVGSHDSDDVTMVRTVLDVSPRSAVIVLRQVDTPILVSDLVAAGARGYLLSKVTPEELVVTIRAISGDEERVVLSVPRHCLRPPGSASLGGLSSRERDVLVLVAKALSNAQIASRLLITEATVKRHLQNIYRKLGAASRLDAVNRASSSGLIDAPTQR